MTNNKSPAPTTTVPQPKEEQSDSSTEEETDTEEESDTEETSKKDSKEMAKTDIGPLLARSAHARDNNSESRRSSKDESAQSVISRRSIPKEESISTSAYSRRRPTVTEEESPPSRYGYTSRFLNKSRSSAAVQPPDEDESPSRYGGQQEDNESKYPTGRSRYMALKERRQRLARSRSSHNFADEDEPDEPLSPTSTSPSAYLASRGYSSGAIVGNDLSRSRSSHALKSRENSPERPSPGAAEKDGAALSSWARYLKNKYGNRTSGKDKESTGSSSAVGSSANSSAAARRLSLGLPLRSSTELGSSDDDQKNMQGSPTTPTAVTVAAAAGNYVKHSIFCM